MADSIKHIARQLSESEDPHIRYKIMRSVYQRPAASRELSILRDEIAASPLVSPLAQTASVQLAHSLLDCYLYCKPGTSDPLGTDFVSLHYPCYDSADVLFALKVMSETGYATDPRSSPAVQLLRSKQLADGTFPAERKHYRPGRSEKGDDSLVNWGGTHRARGNIFVTLDALGSLRAAGERF